VLIRNVPEIGVSTLRNITTLIVDTPCRHVCDAYKIRRSSTFFFTKWATTLIASWPEIGVATLEKITTLNVPSQLCPTLKTHDGNYRLQSSRWRVPCLPLVQSGSVHKRLAKPTHTMRVVFISRLFSKFSILFDEFSRRLLCVCSIFAFERRLLIDIFGPLLMFYVIFCPLSTLSKRNMRSPDNIPFSRSRSNIQRLV